MALLLSINSGEDSENGISSELKHPKATYFKMKVKQYFLIQLLLYSV